MALQNCRSSSPRHQSQPLSNANRIRRSAVRSSPRCTAPRPFSDYFRCEAFGGISERCVLLSRPPLTHRTHRASSTHSRKKGEAKLIIQLKHSLTQTWVRAAAVVCLKARLGRRARRGGGAASLLRGRVALAPAVRAAARRLRAGAPRRDLLRAQRRRVATVRATNLRRLRVKTASPPHHLAFGRFSFNKTRTRYVVRFLSPVSCARVCGKKTWNLRLFQEIQTRHHTMLDPRALAYNASSLALSRGPARA